MQQSIAIFLNDYTLLGGVEKVTVNLARLFFSNGFQNISIISMYASNPHNRIELPVYVLSDSAVQLSTKEEAKLVDNFLRKNNITTIILQVQGLAVCSQIIKRCAGINCVPVLHNTPQLYLKWYLPKHTIKSFLSFHKWTVCNRFYFNIILKHCSKFICLSEKCRKEFISDFNKSRYLNKVDVIPNPLTFSESAMDNSISKENRIIYAGRLVWNKGVLQLLHLWKELSKNCKDWYLDIVGDGELYAEMQQIIEKESIRNIIMHGKQNDMRPFFQKSKICILLSRFEGLPTVLLEASSYRNALIAFDCDGGVSDIVHDGLNGFLIPDNDIETASARLQQMIDNENLILQMGEKAYQNLSEYSNEKVMEKWIKVLKAIQ
jgi:glycosyltransferase involved in cell wall biosynthesis